MTVPATIFSFQGVSMFVASKPLQIMIALHIISQSEFEVKPVICIIDRFKNSKEIFNKLSISYSDKIEFKYYSKNDGVLKATRKSMVDYLFIDSDVGTLNALQLLNFKRIHRGLEICVYEEGHGTYRKDIYTRYKSKILQSFGIGTFFGGFRFTDKIFVYNPYEYKNNIPHPKPTIIKIPNSLSEFIIDNIEALMCIFMDASISIPKNKTDCCILYVTDWSLQKSDLETICTKNINFFIKPHPAIKNYNKLEPLKGETLIESSIPAELVILFLLQKYKKVIVYSKNSSVKRYLYNKRLEYIDILS